MEVTTQVDSSQVTFLLDDDAPIATSQRYVEEGTLWLRDARRRLTRAIAYSTRAISQPDKVAPVFWELFHVYLGGPIHTPDNTVAILRDFNPVLAAMGKTLKGLSGDVTLADLSRMPGIAKFQVGCMNAVCKAKGVPAPQFAGLVFVDLAEAAGRYLSSLWKDKGSSSGFMDPYAGNIHLNFADLLQHGDRPAVVTLIHEGTHKFAQTTDEQYFPDEGARDLLDHALDRCRPMLQMYDKFEDMLAAARQIAFRTGPLREAYTNVQEMSAEKAHNNADGIAQFAYEASELPDEDELGRIVRAVMKGR